VTKSFELVELQRSCVLPLEIQRPTLHGEKTETKFHCRLQGKMQNVFVFFIDKLLATWGDKVMQGILYTGGRGWYRMCSRQPTVGLVV
jgi:hypothetical protein